MKRLLFIVFVFFYFNNNAQVGIGTTTPDASSILDISATNKGVLFPRIALPNIATTQLDGSNTAATGLIIWNTNTTTVGGSGIGLYQFNGVTWSKLATEPLITGDVDWYEQGTTQEPTSINDQIYTLGSVAIGNTATNAKLGVTSDDRVYGLIVNNTLTSSSRGIQSQVASTNGSSRGLEIINNSTGGAINYGIFNNVGENLGMTGTKYGIYNNVASSNGLSIGNYNLITGTNGSTQYGTFNYIDNQGNNNQFGNYSAIVSDSNGTHYGSYSVVNGDGSGDKYGFYSFITGAGNGAKYGFYTNINSATGGTHYGIFSRAPKSGSFAGFFLGNVAVGTNTSNTYTLPASRGTANQIMQTDGSGNVSWQDLTLPTSTTTAFKVRNHTSFIFSNAVITRLIFNSVEFNLGGGSYDNTTGVYTIPETGVYEINVSLNTSFGGATEDHCMMSFRIFRNGGIADQIRKQGGAIRTTSYTHTFSTESKLYCAANDEIYIEVVNVYSGTGPTIFGGMGPGSGSLATNFSIIKID